jgi:hypothetical protein
LQFQNSGYQINNKLDSLELNSKVSETVSNKLQVGYTHFNDFRNPFSTPAPIINIKMVKVLIILSQVMNLSIHNTLDQKYFKSLTLNTTGVMFLLLEVRLKNISSKLI